MKAATLKTLIDMADKELSLETEQLGRATKVLEDAQLQAKTLEEYRKDYERKLLNAMKQGVGRQVYQNYQSFLSKLDEAIAGQYEMVAYAERSLLLQREKWLDAQKNKMSYELLLKQSLEKMHQTELKRDQKLMDEFAARKGLKKQD